MRLHDSPDSKCMLCVPISVCGKTMNLIRLFTSVKQLFISGSVLQSNFSMWDTFCHYFFIILKIPGHLLSSLRHFSTT